MLPDGAIFDRRKLMVFAFAAIGAVVALIPGGSFVLIPLELIMLYMIADKNNAFELPPFLAMGAGIATMSAVLKGLASLMHVVPIVGQIANSLVAFGFIVVVGLLAEKYYSGKTKP
jgi:hypothetical protein